MFKKAILVMLLISGACMINSASALYLKVDFAYPEMVQGDPCFVERFDLTAKDGWFPWADPSFKDCWRHDRTWCATYPDVGELPGGVNGTGINFQVDSGTTSEGTLKEGGKRFAAYGMQQVTDGGYATGHPLGEPIANSGMSTFDSPEKRSVVLVIKGLGPGTYYLETYHNCGWDVDDPYYNNPDSALGYYNVPDINMAKIWVRGPDVTQLITPEDFPIQREQVDANLVLVTTVFTKTDVCDCNVAFMPGLSGKVMVNAFILSTGKWCARDPEPENNATNICPGVSLCWTSDESVEFHDVYLGTDWNDVNDATTSTAGIYKDRIAGDETCYTPVGLELGTTYYWRIDSIADANLWKGDVWSFTTNDGNNFDPYPTDNATKIHLDVNSFSWTAGCSAATHDVFFGTNADDVNNATPGSHPNVTYTPGTAPGSYDPPGPLAYATHYYWRADAVASGGGQRWHGQVWHFKTKSEVDDPSLLVRYQFDELPPSIVAFDSSGNEFEGAIGGDPNDWDPTGGRFGGCRIFGGRCTLPADVPKTITSAITISMWLKDLPSNDGTDWTNLVLDASSSILDWRMRVMVPSNQDASKDWPGYILWRAGMEPNDRLSWDLDGVKIRELDDWHHWMFIKDEITQTMKIYFDGTLAASASGTTIANLASMYPNNILICGNQGGSGGGSATMDDFRIYNRALSDSDVLEVFRGDDLWSAWFPQPRDFAMNVLRDLTLTWKPGDYAVSHDVYFGTDFDDVNDATTASDVYEDRVGPNSYGITDLDLGRNYYWRIDEVNTTDPNIWKGKTWKFTVANYTIVDDFESYTCDNDMYVNWLDWYYNGTGSTLLLSASGDPTHTGDKSMLYSYNNSYDPYYSEAERVLGAGERNWTDAGVEILTMYFYGKSTNAAGSTETLNVSITDGGNTETVLYGDHGESMSDIQLEDWTEWNIALSEFSPVTLSNVTSMFVDFGQSGGSTAGGMGIVYFDDFRLYPSRCVPAKGLMAADLNGNCVIDIADVGMMGMHWLLTDVNFPDRGITVTEPSAANLVGFWKLEGNGNDSSGKGNNGTPQGTYSWVTGYDSVNQAIEFVNGKVLVPDNATLKPASVVSAACWVYYDGNPGDSARVVVKGPDNFEAYCIQAGTYAFTFYVGDVNGTRYFADCNEGDVRPDEWLHVGGTYDGTTVKSYVNGLVMGTADANSIPLSQDANGLAIGNLSDANDRPYAGIVDEVRVYNVALSQAEMAWLATDGTGYVPLQSKANLYDEESEGNKSVNMRDYAELMLSWLDEKLWPRDY